MMKVADTLHVIRDKKLVNSPLLPIIIQPLTQARNIFFGKQIVIKDFYQNKGRELHLLARNLNASSENFHHKVTTGKLQIQNVTQAAVAGLYVTQTLAPLPDYSRYLAGHQKSAASHSSSSLITDCTSYPTDKGESVGQSSWPFTVEPHRYSAKRIPSPSKPDAFAKKSSGPNHSIKHTGDRRLGKTAFVPERRFHGRLAERAEVQLKGPNQQPGIKLSKQRVKHRLTGPGGKIPAAPSLADFIETGETSRQKQLLPDENVPAAPSLSDFIIEHNADRSSAMAITPHASPLEANDVGQPLPMPAEGLPASATKPATDLTGKAGHFALSGAGSKLGAKVGVVGSVAILGAVESADAASRSSDLGQKITHPAPPVANPDKYPVSVKTFSHPAAAKLDYPDARTLPVTAKPFAPLATPETDFTFDTLDDPALQRQIIDRCKMTLGADQYGHWVTNLNSEYYGQQTIYEVRRQGADISVPVVQRYVLMAGKRIAVRPVVMPSHGVKYEIYDQDNPAKGYALAVSAGQWQLQELTSPQLSQSLIQAIPRELIDTDCMEATLSVPDDRGLQWTRDHKSYLRIKGCYMRIFQNENNINHYRVESPDGLYSIDVYYHKSRFELSAGHHDHRHSNTSLRKRSMHRELIYHDLKTAYIYIKNNNIIKCFEKIKSAFDLHMRIEAGPINQLIMVTLDFLEHSFQLYDRDELQDADKLTIQNAWIKNIRLPLYNNVKINSKRMSRFFANLPLLLKRMAFYVLDTSHRDILKKFHACIVSVNTEPMPQYSINSRKKRYQYRADGMMVLTNISIYGNNYFIYRVTCILNDIIKTKLGNKIISALKDKIFDIQPPTMNAIERVKHGKFYAKNSAGGNIAFDPDNEIAGRESAVRDEPWRERAPAIALYHELLHIYYKYHGMTLISVDGKVKQKITGGHSEVDEGLIVGVNVYKEKTTSLFEFGNKAYLAKYQCEPISENDFRKEYAQMYHKEYVMRPYYVKHHDKTSLKKANTHHSRARHRPA